MLNNGGARCSSLACILTTISWLLPNAWLLELMLVWGRVDVERVGTTAAAVVMVECGHQMLDETLSFMGFCFFEYG